MINIQGEAEPVRKHNTLKLWKGEMQNHKCHLLWRRLAQQFRGTIFSLLQNLPVNTNLSYGYLCFSTFEGQHYVFASVIV